MNKARKQLSQPLPFVWGVEYKGTSSYLIGTMHSVTSKRGVSAAKLLIDACDALYAESIRAEGASLDFQPKHCKLPNGQTIDDLLGKEQAKALLDEINTCYRHFYHGSAVRHILRRAQTSKLWYTALEVKGLERMVVFGAEEGRRALLDAKRYTEISLQLNNAEVLGISPTAVRQLYSEQSALQQKIAARETQPRTKIMDEHLVGYAASVQKQLVSLDSADEYALLWDTIPIPVQHDYLHSLLRYIMKYATVDGRKQETIANEEDLFIRGDLFAFEQQQAALVAETPTGAVIFDRTVVSRTKLWHERLRPELGQRSLVIVAGMGHMVGEHGLVSLFRADGYKVTRI